MGVLPDGREQPGRDADRLSVGETLLDHERAPCREVDQVAGGGTEEPSVPVGSVSAPACPATSASASIRFPASVACWADRGIAAASR